MQRKHLTLSLTQITKLIKVAVFIITPLLSVGVLAGQSSAAIHNAPVVIPAYKIRQISSHPVGMYRLFRSDKKGKAVAIPFQIDELNFYTDFILPNGPLNNQKTSNGIFDQKDELSFMGNDVGPAKKPTHWSKNKPPILYEILISNSTIKGAVYVGVYFFNPPKVSKKSYVVFDQKKAEVLTSRFKYKFDRKNYLVVRGVDLKKRDGSTRPIIDSSTFYLKADLKYFLTLEVNHRGIESKLEAFKVGPIRTIVRVSFTYSMLRLKFNLGMYTEVSFFSNAVYLPAIMYNPLNSKKTLNQGSGFYYGFNFVDNPANSNVKSNMPEFKESNILDFFKEKQKVEPMYWVTANTDQYMIYMEVAPSPQMRQSGNVPMLYQEPKKADEISSRKNDKAYPLGKSPVNLAMYFDITRFSEGEHIVAFHLFFENLKNKKRLEEFKNLSDWSFDTRRL